MLRVGARVLQAVHAQLQQQPVFVGQRVVQMRIGLRGPLQRHPVMAVLGEQREPVVEAAGVEQRGLGGDEVCGVGHDAGSAMYFAHARNWLRISSSLVPLVVIVSCPSSAESKLRCRLTHSLPSAFRPC